MGTGKQTHGGGAVVVGLDRGGNLVGHAPLAVGAGNMNHNTAVQRSSSVVIQGATIVESHFDGMKHVSGVQATDTVFVGGGR